MKKNIVIINHFSGIPGINESSLRHYLLAKKLSSKDCNVTILCSAKNYQTQENINIIYNTSSIIEGVEYIFIKEKFFKKINLFTKFLRMISFSYNLLKSFILKRINIGNVDVVLSSSPDLFTSFAAYIIAWNKKAKFILEIRDIWPLSQVIHHKFSKKHPLIIILRMIELFLHKKADYVTSQLNNYQKYLEDNNISVQYLYIPQIYNQPLRKEKIAIELPYKKFDKIGIYAGTIGSFYKIENLLKYFPDNLREKIAIIIIGDGDRWNCIDDLIKKNHLNNIFLMKSVKKEILMNYYEISDFAISSHPSEPDLYKYGLCPLKDIDYMYNNLPILFMGDKSYLNNSSSSGIVEVDSNDKYSIEKNLNFVSNLSKEELNILGFENYKIVEKFNNPKLLYNLYERIINELH